VDAAAGEPATPKPTLADTNGTPVKLTGYLEWRRDAHVVVDGQRVRWNGNTRFKLRKPLTIETVSLGEEVEVHGVRLADGTVLARTFAAKPNGVALFEAEVRAYSDVAESTYVEKGTFLQLSSAGHVRSLGTVINSGPEVDRCSAIVRKLLPPTTSRAEVRVYVIDSPDWNAMVMPNGAMWVFRGLLREMDDDEVAAVIGHEIAHYTHEHVRRAQKRALWGQLLAGVAQGVASQLSNTTAAAATQLGAYFALNAWVNGYSRDQEDQADRVALRYAYEAGYDVRRGAAIWQRFAAKYGQGDRFTNFFYGNHSLATARLANLHREIAYNYRSPADTEPARPTQFRNSPLRRPGVN
jgi:Zn-dependent protease with chaperone function